MRHFIVEDDGRIFRLPNKVYREMMEETGSHRRPEHAGKRVRLAEVLFKVDGEGRLTEFRSIYRKILFDKRGYLDAQGDLRMAVNLVGILEPPSKTAKLQYERTCFWKPNKQMEDQILARAAGLLPCPVWTSGKQRKEPSGRRHSARDNAATVRDRVLALRTSREPAQLSGQDYMGSTGASFDPHDIADSRHRAAAEVVRRPGQRAFRDQVLRAYSVQCAISGCKVLEVLECAHIHPHLGEVTDNITNAVLLRSDLHKLLDCGKIWIDERTYEARIDSSLRNTEYEKFEGQRLTLPRRKEHWPSPAALQWHRKRCTQSR